MEGAGRYVVGLVAALRRRPRATVLASGLKFAWMEAIARQYDRRDGSDTA